MNTVVAKIAASKSGGEAKQKRVRVGTPLYNEIVEFLYEEAALLDDLDIAEWSQLLAEDLVYTAPLRLTRSSADRDKNIDHTMYHFEDDYFSIMARVERLQGKSAFAEDPPSRTRRFVTNVRVRKTDNPDEFEVISYILLTRNRYEASAYQLMSAKRNDLIRRDGDDFKLARREIILDQAVLGMPNLAVFL
jgi:3-phenylpropionate/cinnamic acid dioxygenase small subunit